MERYLAVVLTLLSAVAVAQAQTPALFLGTVIATNDPLVQGQLTFQLYYDFAGQQMEIDYTAPSTINGFREIYLFSSTQLVRYLVCTSSCDAETWKNGQPRLHAISGDASVSGTSACGAGGTIVAPTNSPGGVSQIHSNSNGLPCKVVFTSGKVWSISNWASFTVSSTLFKAPSSCPQKQCASLLDVVFLLDESGSIVPSEWTQLVAFVQAMVKGFTVGPQATAVGFVKFSSGYTTVASISSCSSCVTSTANGLYTNGGNTCTTCGIRGTMAMFANSGRTFNGIRVPRVTIIITDGDANVQVDQLPAAAASLHACDATSTANGGCSTVFAVGVGPGVATNTLNLIASTIPGVTTVFPVTSWGQLNNLLTTLEAQTCVDLPTSNCGSGCLGFCGCGGQCLCPTCNDNNQCTTDSCTPGSFNTGCRYTPITCNDNNACTIDTCNPATGCVFTPQPASACQKTDECYTYACDAVAGCTRSPVSCSDNDPCSVDSCVTHGTTVLNKTLSCVHTIPPGSDCSTRCSGVSCTPMTCGINQCDPSTNPGQCKFTPMNCDDGNGCTVDTCQNDTCIHTPISCDDANACTTDSCDPANTPNFCVHTPLNETTFCDDGQLCTVDKCNPNFQGVYPGTGAVPAQCYHTPVTCPTPDVCHLSNCSENQGGCYTPFVDCEQVPSIKVLLASGDCYTTFCAITQGGCYLEQRPNTTIDNCGYCNGDNSECSFSLQGSTAAALGGLAIAAIVIAVIAVVAALALVAGQKGYDIWAKGHKSLAGAQTNPTYQAGNLTGRNPLYEQTEMK